MLESMRIFGRRFIKYYFPAILWAGIIFYFSSVPDLQMNTGIVTLEIFVRKLAHIIEYAILCWLIFRLTFEGHKLSFRSSLFWSFAVAVLYAVSDEYHQTFTPGRSGKVIDVIFDAISAFLGLQIIYGVILKKFNLSRWLYILASIALLIAMEFGMIMKSKEVELKENIEIENSDLVEAEAVSQNNAEIFHEDAPPETYSSQEISLPLKIKIEVPFTTQAPFANWDEIHEEACEEASLIMLKYYLDGKKINPEIAEKEIQKMVTFENKKYGDYKDTTAAESVKLFNEFYGEPANGIKLKVIYDFSAEDIKKYLAKNKPIVVPAAGRELGNPNFAAPGPLYHNLVLIGYEGNTIITNDPGTRKGQNYRYNIDVLYKAIHDFPGKPEDILKGRKAMIVLE